MFDGNYLEPISRDQVEAEVARLGHFDSGAVDMIHGLLVFHRAEVYGEDRLDANETAVLQLMLEQIRARPNETKYPDLKGRLFVPVTSEVDPGTDTWGYALWNETGMADIIANYADDVSKVAVSAQKFTFPIETIAKAYDWSWLDMRRAAKAGIPLQSRKATAVRNAFERRIEEICAVGIKGTAAKGLVNNANVPIMAAAAAAGGGHSTVWGVDKTPEEVVTELLKMESTIAVNTLDVEKPDTALFSLTKYNYIQNTGMTLAGGNTSKDTILEVFLKRAKYIKNVDWWTYLDTASAAGGHRAVMYKRDPQVVHLELPLEQQEMPPQVKNLVMEIISVGRVGGVAIEYPLGALYMDGH